MGTERKNKGFTLIELLVVMAIIGVLVAVAIPIFAKQLQKSQNATDMANAKIIAEQVETYYATNPDRLADLKTISSSNPWAVEIIVTPDGMRFYTGSGHGAADARVLADMQSIFGGYNYTDSAHRISYVNSVSCKSSAPWKQYCVAITTQTPVLHGDHNTDTVHVIYTAWSSIDYGTYRWDHLISDSTGFKTLMGGDQ